MSRSIDHPKYLKAIAMNVNLYHNIGGKIERIKELRAISGASLKEAKEAIEDWEEMSLSERQLIANGAGVQINNSAPIGVMPIDEAVLFIPHFLERWNKEMTSVEKRAMNSLKQYFDSE